MITLLEGLPHSFYTHNHGASHMDNAVGSYADACIYSRLGAVSRVMQWQFSGFGLYTRISGSFIDWGARNP